MVHIFASFIVALKFRDQKQLLAEDGRCFRGEMVWCKIYTTLGTQAPPHRNSSNLNCLSRNSIHNCAKILPTHFLILMQKRELGCKGCIEKIG
jgi:hypothetical protein